MIFAIRTRRVPFFRSRPSKPLTVTTLTCVAIGALLPFSPAGHVLGFRPFPATFFAFLSGMVVVYLVLIEFGKCLFYSALPAGQPLARAHPQRALHDRASRWSVTDHVATAKKRVLRRRRSHPHTSSAHSTV